MEEGTLDKHKARVETAQQNDINVPTFILLMIGLLLVWGVGMYYTTKGLDGVRQALDEQTAALKVLNNSQAFTFRYGV